MGGLAATSRRWRCVQKKQRRCPTHGGRRLMAVLLLLLWLLWLLLFWL